MAEMSDERPRCGAPCLKHAHACDRSPGHFDFHRDVQQKGDHSCEWGTPGPKDFAAVMAALRDARAELARWEGHDAVTATLVKQAETDRDDARAENRELRADLVKACKETADLESLAVDLGVKLKRVEALRDRWKAATRDPSAYSGGGVEHAAALAASHLPELCRALDGTEADR